MAQQGLSQWEMALYAYNLLLMTTILLSRREEPGPYVYANVIPELPHVSSVDVIYMGLPVLFLPATMIHSTDHPYQGHFNIQ